MCLPSSASGISAVSAVKPAEAELFPDGVAGEAQGARVDDQDALDPLPQQSGQAGQQAAAHHDVVVLTGRLPGDLDDG